MNIERINADVQLQGKPHTGDEAHQMLIDALLAEIEEKQMVLHELLDEDTKQKFVSQWTPGTTNVNISL